MTGGRGVEAGVDAAEQDIEPWRDDIPNAASLGGSQVCRRRTSDAPHDGAQSAWLRRRSAFAITETELKVMAALANIGLSNHPKAG